MYHQVITVCYFVLAMGFEACNLSTCLSALYAQHRGVKADFVSLDILEDKGQVD